MEKAFIILSALILSLVLGLFAHLLPLQRLQAYAAMPGGFLRDMERRLNREHRSVEERMRRGFLLVAFALSAALFIGWLLGVILPAILQLLFIAFTLPLYSSWQRSGAVRSALQADNVNAAREALAGTAFRHHALLDAHGAARAAVEYLAVQGAEKIIAPVFWFCVLGLPGLCASIAVTLLQENLCGAATNPQPFGKAAHDAHRLVQYIPSRLAAGFWIAASLFLPGLNWQPAAKHIYAGLPSASAHRLALLSAANALGLSLGGPMSAYCNDSWVGQGRAKATAQDVKRGQYLCALTQLFLFIGLGFLLFI